MRYSKHLLIVVQATAILIALPWLTDVAAIGWGLKCYVPEFPQAMNGVIVPRELPVVTVTEDVIRVFDGTNMSVPIREDNEIVLFAQRIRELQRPNDAIAIEAGVGVAYPRVALVLECLRAGGVEKVYFITKNPEPKGIPTAQPSLPLGRWSSSQIQVP